MKKLLLRTTKLIFVIISLHQIKDINITVYAFLLLLSLFVFIFETVRNIFKMIYNVVKSISSNRNQTQTETLEMEQTQTEVLEMEYDWQKEPPAHKEETDPTWFYDFDVEEQTEEIDYYIPDCIAEPEPDPEEELKQKQKKYKQDVKIAEAMSSIDFYEPLLQEQRNNLEQLEDRRKTCNDMREYDKADKIAQQIIRVKTNIFKTEQKLERAYAIIDFPI